ncbi:hypothetical protein PV325_002087 [Microctonus aethiopoides]|nr:hypothetical protein PV325_002087 [Microctonus aethiopoides]
MQSTAITDPSARDILTCRHEGEMGFTAVRRIYDRVVPRCDDRGSLRGSFTIVSQSSGIQSEWEDVQCVLDDSSGADDAAACLINLLVAIVGFASSKSIRVSSCNNNLVQV